jgi:hypothetical protein
MPWPPTRRRIWTYARRRCRRVWWWPWMGSSSLKSPQRRVGLGLPETGFQDSASLPYYFRRQGGHAWVGEEQVCRRPSCHSCHCHRQHTCSCIRKWCTCHTGTQCRISACAGGKGYMPSSHACASRLASTWLPQGTSSKMHSCCGNTILVGLTFRPHYSEDLWPRLSQHLSSCLVMLYGAIPLHASLAYVLIKCR